MPVKKPNLVLIIVYTMTQLRIFPLIFANALAAPGRNQELYSCLTRIEGELKQQAFDVFEALDQLTTPDDDYNAAIQKLKLNIDIEYIREIYSYARLNVRKIFRLHHPDLFANLSDKEKLNLANKLAEPDHEKGMYFLLKRIKASDVFMALDQLTVPGDEHNVAIDVLASTEYCYLLRSIFPCLSEEVQNIMLPYNSVILCLADLLDYNLNKPNSKRSRLSRRFP